MDNTFKLKVIGFVSDNTHPIILMTQHFNRLVLSKEIINISFNNHKYRFMVDTVTVTSKVNGIGIRVFKYECKLIPMPEVGNLTFDLRKIDLNSLFSYFSAEL